MQISSLNSPTRTEKWRLERRIFLKIFVDTTQSGLSDFQQEWMNVESCSKKMRRTLEPDQVVRCSLLRCRSRNASDSPQNTKEHEINLEFSSSLTFLLIWEVDLHYTSIFMDTRYVFSWCKLETLWEAGESLTWNFILVLRDAPAHSRDAKLNKWKHSQYSSDKHTKLAEEL